MVEDKRIELLTTLCKSIVLPLALIPHKIWIFQLFLLNIFILTVYLTAIHFLATDKIMARTERIELSHSDLESESPLYLGTLARVIKYYRTFVQPTGSRHIFQANFVVVLTDFVLVL